MQCRILHNVVEKVGLFVYLLYSDLVIANTSDPSFPEENHLYTEVDEAEKERDGLTWNKSMKIHCTSLPLLMMQN